MSSSATTIQLGEADDGRLIAARVGAVIELRLPENPTTGFRWRLAAAGEPVCMLAGDAFTPAGKKPGQSGTHVWRFQITAAGEAKIEMHSRRGWELDATKVFSLQLRAQK